MIFLFKQKKTKNKGRTLELTRNITSFCWCVIFVYNFTLKSVRQHICLLFKYSPKFVLWRLISPVRLACKSLITSSRISWCTLTRTSYKTGSLLAHGKSCFSDVCWPSAWLALLWVHFFAFFTWSLRERLSSYWEHWYWLLCITICLYNNLWRFCGGGERTYIVARFWHSQHTQSEGRYFHL